MYNCVHTQQLCASFYTANVYTVFNNNVNRLEINKSILVARSNLILYTLQIETSVRFQKSAIVFFRTIRQHSLCETVRARIFAQDTGNCNFHKIK